MNEFEIIEKYFAPLSRDGLKDDCAVLGVPVGQELVITSDTLNEGIHFFPKASPANIARKALRVNLSDLASSGANPLCYQLNIAFPQKPALEWLEGFTNALKQENEKYKIYCSGGDTTSIKGALSISITALGIVPKGKAIRRQNAKEGDALIITGVCGDAALALKNKDTRFLPSPRTGLEGILHNHVNAAADISDGLLADAMHMAQASKLGLEVDLNKIKFSQNVQNAIKNSDISYETALKGGDDYELALSVAECNATALINDLKAAGLSPQKIGRFTARVSGLTLKNVADKQIDQNALGWTHF